MIRNKTFNLLKIKWQTFVHCKSRTFKFFFWNVITTWGGGLYNSAGAMKMLGLATGESWSKTTLQRSKIWRLMVYNMFVDFYVKTHYSFELCFKWIRSMVSLNPFNTYIPFINMCWDSLTALSILANPMNTHNLNALISPVL